MMNAGKVMVWNFRRLLCAAFLGVAATGIAGQVACAEGRDLVIAGDMEINSLDPARTYSDTSALYDVTVYEQLVTLDSNNKLQPLLAKSWSVNAQQTVFTFNLDSNARFADGSPVESKDVKWSLERLKNINDHGSFLAGEIASIETPDAQTVIIRLAGPHSEFIHQAAAGMLSIINSDVAAANGARSDETAAQKDSSEAWFASQSAGSGPFILDHYAPGLELRLKRNENYWKARALLPGVVFKQVKDASAQAEMLRSGAADIAMQIDTRTAQTLKGADVVIDIEPSSNFVYLALAPGAKDMTIKLSPEVRQAISLAIDRNAIVNLTLGSDGGRLLAAPIPLDFPGGKGHPAPEYNPAKATELLASAGLAGGFRLKSVYPDVNVYGVDFSMMMKAVKADLQKVGIELELLPVPFVEWRKVVNGEHIPLTASFFTPDFYGTSQYVHFFGMSKGSVWAHRAGAVDDPSLFNSRTAELRSEALAAGTAAEADKLWFEAGEEMIKSKIILPVVSPNRVLAYGAKIKGVRSSACCALSLAEISY